MEGYYRGNIKTYITSMKVTKYSLYHKLFLNLEAEYHMQNYARLVIFRTKKILNDR